MGFLLVSMSFMFMFIVTLLMNYRASGIDFNIMITYFFYFIDDKAL